MTPYAQAMIDYIENGWLESSLTFEQFRMMRGIVG